MESADGKGGGWGGGRMSTTHAQAQGDRLLPRFWDAEAYRIFAKGARRASAEKDRPHTLARTRCRQLPERRGCSLSAPPSPTASPPHASSPRRPHWRLPAEACSQPIGGGGRQPVVPYSQADAAFVVRRQSVPLLPLLRASPASHIARSQTSHWTRPRRVDTRGGKARGRVGAREGLRVQPRQVPDKPEQWCALAPPSAPLPPNVHAPLAGAATRAATARVARMNRMLWGGKGKA